MSTSAIPDIEREFTLFPKLPPELRVKTCKYALPGPRVIPLCIDDSGTRPCRSANALITIKLACHKALEVVKKNYVKYVPVLKSQTDFIQDDQGRQAFVCINYDLDTIYIHQWGRFEQMEEKCLSRAKHLAWRGNELLSQNFDWAVLRAACPLMKSLTLPGTQNRNWRYHDEEWMFLDIPDGFGPAIELPEWDGGWDSSELADSFDNYGYLALKCAEAKQVREEFHEYVKKHEEWKTVDFQIAVLGHREIGSLPWSLSYFLYTPEEDEDGEDDIHGLSHWHDEPVYIEHHVLGSCQPREKLPKRHRCRICREQRWLDYNDAFWLGEDDEADIDGAQKSPNRPRNS